MQDYQIKSNFITADNIKNMTVNNYPQDVFRQKNFLNGLQNARNLLKHLQESLEETRKYENELMRCRSTHLHEHEDHTINEWLSDHEHEQNHKTWQSSGSETQDYGAIESWSTMSIVCLQYQYEELSKRYKSLLCEYSSCCEAANAKNTEVARLQALASSTHAQLMDAHTMLLAVGEKYMSLRERKLAMKHAYSKKVHQLRRAVKELIAAADRARRELDSSLKKAMRTERHGAAAMLLAEIQKCNNLCLENLRLKAEAQELIPRENTF
ncbi:uncharacterized protein LOC133523405 [Cydia pomonella]|uniref:uncharacterized protein LOC133523405 n=1 Tax=Cydia pomonella TaxID=82600 RepID=UPI002ADDFD3B|nr:uncharacterized protein LOC133523405 [Cydia pomonella]